MRNVPYKLKRKNSGTKHHCFTISPEYTIQEKIYRENSNLYMFAQRLWSFGFGNHVGSEEYHSEEIFKNDILESVAEDFHILSDHCRIHYNRIRKRSGEFILFLDYPHKNVYKLSKPGFNVIDLIYSKLLYNDVFVDTRYTLEQVIKINNTHQLLFSQRYFNNCLDVPTEEMIDDKMHKLGFRKVCPSVYENDFFRLEDITSDNVLLVNNSDVKILDSIISLRQPLSIVLDNIFARNNENCRLPRSCRLV